MVNASTIHGIERCFSLVLRMLLIPNKSGERQRRRVGHNAFTRCKHLTIHSPPSLAFQFFQPQSSVNFGLFSNKINM
ncbi:hypothetical protein RJT34_28925 [Clitoria ternatea]|uniref:Uncharacterized protein n=1 Tax=Clitoria ternatea TaxID=43366 RepID=A0AAN9ICV6_CLITE